MQVFREVKQNWYQVLPKIFTKWDPQRHAAELEELLDALKRLRFNAFDVSDALGLLNIVNWIAGGVCHNFSFQPGSDSPIYSTITVAACNVEQTCC